MKHSSCLRFLPASLLALILVGCASQQKPGMAGAESGSLRTQAASKPFAASGGESSPLPATEAGSATTLPPVPNKEGSAAASSESKADGKPQSDAETKSVSPAPETAEASFPYRRAITPGFIVASLPEPELPKNRIQQLPAPVPKSTDLAATDSTSSGDAAKKASGTSPNPKPDQSAAGNKTVVKPETPPKEEPKPKTKPEAKAPAKDQPKAAPPAETPAKPVEKSEDPKNAASSLAVSETAMPEPATKPDIPRNFNATEGQRFEVPFQGTGWTFLGEKDQKEGISYDSRRFDGSSVVFILNPVKAGDYILRFQRQDALRGISYEELVAVTVAPKTAQMGQAQSQPSVQPQQSQPSGQTQQVQPSGQAQQTQPQPPTSALAQGSSSPASPASASTQAARAQTSQPAASTFSTQNAALPTASAAANPTAVASVPASQLASPEAALAQARSDLAAAKYQNVLDDIDRLWVLAPAGTDEALLLYAKALEANGAQKNIQKAYDYYKKLRDTYPESPYWDEADQRATYIERHYFDIR